jgi:hypothetical protein
MDFRILLDYLDNWTDNHSAPVKDASMPVSADGWENARIWRKGDALILNLEAKPNRAAQYAITLAPDKLEGDVNRLQVLKRGGTIATLVRGESACDAHRRILSRLKDVNIRSPQMPTYTKFFSYV